MVGIIKNELINTLANYLVQLNQNKANANEIIMGIKKYILSFWPFFLLYYMWPSRLHKKTN